MYKLICLVICAFVFASHPAFSDEIQEINYSHSQLGEETQISVAYQRLANGTFLIHDLEVDFKDNGSSSEKRGEARYSFSDIVAVYEGAPILNDPDRTEDGFRTFIKKRIIIEFKDKGQMVLTESIDTYLVTLEGPKMGTGQVFVMSRPRPESSEKTELRSYHYVHVAGYGDRFYRYFPTDDEFEERLKRELALKRHSILNRAGARFAVCNGLLHYKFSVIDGGKK